eukprot:TRINITY_DN97429_c0_g1_i1.p1 TRINITY_DN97429_c0_g1~~TRINITY_DN97429_c0_g1_i1.p1  ORF type:complete len:273 (-),score=42.58 TRINITY_DN97429_c0_g1_i1:64-843(-)
MSGTGSGSSLREQLCQIEQSLGVCHVAEVQVWPNGSKPVDLRPKTPVPSRSAATGSARRPPPPPAPSKVVGGSPGAVHQPQPPKKAAPVATASAGATTQRLQSLPDLPSLPDDAAVNSTSELDEKLLQKLDTAVDRILVEGSASAGAKQIAPLPRVLPKGVIELGPASPNPPKMQGVSLFQAAPRLPHQLAEIRQQLRLLTSNCDKLQALAAQAKCFGHNGSEPPPLESVEAEHASTMSQASRLLEMLGTPVPVSPAKK